MAGIIIGCLSVGFAIGCAVIAKSSKRQIEELRTYINESRKQQLTTDHRQLPTD